MPGLIFVKCKVIDATMPRHLAGELIPTLPAELGARFEPARRCVPLSHLANARFLAASRFIRLRLVFGTQYIASIAESVKIGVSTTGETADLNRALNSRSWLRHERRVLIEDFSCRRRV